MIDNSTSGFADALPSYKDNLAKAKDVCKLLRRRDAVPKLMARCFSSPVGRHTQPVLKTFRGWIHEGRWGTSAFSMPELVRVEGALRYGGGARATISGATMLTSTRALSARKTASCRCKAILDVCT